MEKQNEKWLQRLVEGYKKTKPNLEPKEPKSLLTEKQRNKINRRD